MITMEEQLVLSAQDLLRYQGEGGIEFAHGQLWEKPVSVETSRVESQINWLLRDEAWRSGGADVFTSSMGYRCFPEEPLRFRKPDVSVVRRERMKNLALDEGFMPVPADLAVEVISPNDLAYDVEKKVEEYLSNGFPLIWVVYPNTRTVIVHRADGPGVVLHQNDQITGEAALPGFACKVADFFAAPA